MLEPSLEQYERIAPVYDLLHPEFASTADSLVALLKKLALLPGRHRLLDCACGSGRQLAALAGAGYAAVGTDVSPRMIDLCRKNLAERGLTASLAVSSWRDLPAHFGREFDAVFCCGNSIFHSPTGADLEEDLASMARVLAPSGRLVIGVSNWTEIPVSGSTYWVQPTQRSDDSDTIPLYIWKEVDADRRATVDAIVIHKGAGGNRLEVFPLEFVLYRLEDICEALETRGLRIREVVAAENPYDDQYVVATRAAAS